MAQVDSGATAQLLETGSRVNGQIYGTCVCIISSARRCALVLSQSYVWNMILYPEQHRDLVL